MPIPGYKNNTVNTLRLWKAEATDEFDLEEFDLPNHFFIIDNNSEFGNRIESEVGFYPVSKSFLESEKSNLENCEVFVCGPEQMILAVKAK